MHVDITGTGLDAGRLQRIAAHLDLHYVSKGKIAGAEVAVGRHGKVAYHASLGLRDRERNVPIGDDTIFRIYSMTKPIATVAAMALAEEGKLLLEAPLAAYIPAFKDMKVAVEKPNPTGGAPTVELVAAMRPKS